METSFGRKLAELRRAAGLTQTEVAERVTAAGFPVRTQAVSKWEKDITQPGAKLFVELCRLYGVENVVNTFNPKTPGHKSPRFLPLYRLAVSAGTGEFLEDAGYDPVEVGEEVSPQADFGVRIAGNSMEPRFVPGQIVWVKRQETLEDGETGVFLCNGSGYCKRLERTGDTVRLISLNPDYPPLEVGREDSFRVLGKVVG